MVPPVGDLVHWVGPRVVKTGLAVFIAVATLHWLQPAWAAFAGVAAFLAVQPTPAQTREALRTQLLGTLFGAAAGIPMGVYLGRSGLTAALGVVLLLLAGTRLHLGEATGPAVITLIFLLDRPEADYVLFSLGRVATLAFGALVGYGVNVLFLRPDFAALARREILSALELTDRFLGRVLNSLAQPESYSKAEIKADSRRIEEVILHARNYQRFHQESAHDAASERLRRAVGTLYVFMERGMDLHKLALQAGGFSGEPLARVQAALAALQAYKNQVMPQATAGRAAAADEGAAFAAALGELNALVDRLVAGPDTRPFGLHLHGAAALLQYMGWRLDSMARPANP